MCIIELNLKVAWPSHMYDGALGFYNEYLSLYEYIRRIWDPNK
jgi:hypothetical protein